jgi:hypothetical protein
MDTKEEIEAFLNKQHTERETKTVEFALRIITLMKEIKDRREDIKVVKSEAKLDGVKVGSVMKIFNKMKQQLKNKDKDTSDEDEILILLREANLIEQIEILIQ